MTKTATPPKEPMDGLLRKDQLTAEEAAQLLGVSTPTVFRLFSQGKLKGWRTTDAWNARVWFYTASVIEFIEKVQGRKLATTKKAR